MARRPLYAGAESACRTAEGHAGLWFDKFCDQWHEVKGAAWSMKGDSNSKLRWINTVTDSTVGMQDQIDAYVSRLIGLVDSRRGRWEVYSATSRFVTGLGRSHPVENGFAWHPTLGTPYLPGSSVKGLIHAWAKAASGGELAGEHKPLFGDIRAAGAVCFLDAVPAAPVRLVADVMTPHYAGWCPKRPPGDWLSPTPIPFLVTEENATFLFGFVPSRETTQDDLNQVADWLTSALEWAGGGAKTSVGYGRMKPDPNLTTRLARQETQRREKRRRCRYIKDVLRSLPSDAAELEKMKIEGRWADRNSFLDTVEGFLQDKQSLSNDAYQRLKEHVSTYWPAILNSPDAVQGKKKKPKYRPRPRALAKKLLSLLVEDK